MPLPTGVVALALPDSMQREVRGALAAYVTVWEAAGARECRSLLERHVGVSIVLRVPNSLEDTYGQRLLDIRALFPHVPCVALFDEAESDSRWTLRLGRAGVVELVSVGRSLPDVALLAALSRCETESLAVKIWRHAQLAVDDRLATVLKPAIRLAHGPISMQRLANATRMHERSLRKFCDHARVPSPQWIIGWARLLVAAYYLDEPGRTIQSIADLLAFPSAIGLANSVRRYTGVTPTELRRGGALASVARMLEVRLAPEQRGPGAAVFPSTMLDRATSPSPSPDGAVTRTARR